ncbi:undecaprenyl-diphosphatase [Oryzomonas japonica]|uniref:Undecaprenyl-diphosphatase n=1 Tax=Oryzomonas japonica TaxID=2603858 RepID=A0A7J4ZNL0_9BACT|nr:undecaprenyl-diphosphatase [Oryzomonas japonica]KAB0664422.1 undecaprenyl-diphosphatase [Oryzomonas japonica]
MEKFNEALFLTINAPAHPQALLLALARGLAEWSIWLIPLILALGWLRGDGRQRRLMLEAAASGGAGLLINQGISLFWQHPRPFMIGLGRTFLAHAPDSSFPSDHATLIWAVAFSLLLHERTRAAGLALALLGLPVAWARIYLGVHFPLDMAGAALVSLVAARLALYQRRHLIGRFYRPVLAFYRLAATPLIRRGWILK